MQGSTVHETIGTILAPINTGLLLVIVFKAGAALQSLADTIKRVDRIEKAVFPRAIAGDS